MIKLAKKLFMILILLIFMITMVAATAYAVSTPTEKKIVEYKEKKVSGYKITWNCNGGKIGPKKTVTTTVKKGSKIAKLATTPKRSEYSFKGWYTKKSGGTKISKNTKPKKSVTYYAQWAKKGSINKNPNIDKKLLGLWNRYTYDLWMKHRVDSYSFRDNGKFTFTYGTSYVINGNYKVSSGKISFTNMVLTSGSVKKSSYPNIVSEYKLEKGKVSDSLRICLLYINPEKTYYSLSSAGLFGKQPF